jgi:hypothetical protein
MSTIVTRAAKGSPLTHAEVDANFNNLNAGKVEKDENMFISDTGNVGIGTMTPGVKVAINDPGTGLGFVNAAGGNFNIGLLGGTSSAEAYVYQRANGPLLLGTNNAERARIDSSGRLLIGTATNTGGALFQVNGDRIRVAAARTPASASAAGAAGEICWDANYVYVCTATNTWKRSALSAW